MFSARHDFIIEQGADFTRRILWRDKATKTPLDLTGYSARMAIKTGYDAVSPVIELTDGNGRISLGGATGEITLSLTAAETEALPVEDPADARMPNMTRMIYDLELIDAGGAVTRLLQGEALISAEVTS